MNGIENDRFLELAQNVMAGNASITEQSELEGLLADHPSLRAQFEQLRRDAVLAREFVPLLDALEAPPVEVPEAERARMRAKVRKVVARLESESAKAQKSSNKGAGSKWWLTEMLKAESAQAMDAICQEKGFSAYNYILSRKGWGEEAVQELVGRFFSWLFENQAYLRNRFVAGVGRPQFLLCILLEGFFLKKTTRAWVKSRKEAARPKNVPPPVKFEPVSSRGWFGTGKKDLNEAYAALRVTTAEEEFVVACSGNPEQQRGNKGDRIERLPSLKILFVESHEVFARIVTREFLSQHAVTVVSSIAAARQARAEAQFDLLLVDYDLDDGKGDAFVRELRLTGDRIAIVGISSHEAGNAALQRAGASAICSKMEFDSIERAIEGLKPRGSTVDGAAGEARKDDQKAEG